MKICILGTGYVGLVTGVGFARRGHDVVCIDISEARVHMVNKGHAPFYEPGLDEALKAAVTAGRLKATNSYACVAQSEVTILCVGTPSTPNGAIDLEFIETASREAGKALKDARDFITIVVKSTVVPGITELVVRGELEKASGRKAGKDFGLAMVPEFLAEGAALKAFEEPARIVLGIGDQRTANALRQLHAGFNCPILEVPITTAEMIKYASNAFLAAKITLANELANISERVGADYELVKKGISLDPRIGSQFLNAGPGFGGSCFNKDVRALIHRAEAAGYEATILKHVLARNATQPLQLVRLAKEARGTRGLRGTRVCVLGLAFKPATDDVRESPALPIMRELLSQGCLVIAFDPKANDNAAKEVPEAGYAASIEEALHGAELCIIVTDWPEFKQPPEVFKRRMAEPVVIDGRRVLDAAVMKAAGIDYRAIGLPAGGLAKRNKRVAH